MGHNDQSDGKRVEIGLTRRHYKRWPQKLLAKTIEDAITNSYLNYLLDPNCEKESWPVFLYWLVDELIQTGENLRAKETQFMRAHKKPKLQRTIVGSEELVMLGKKCKGGRFTISQRWLPLIARTRVCAFCKRRRAMFQCRSCKQHLCLQPPQELDGQTFPKSGPMCFARFHGQDRYTS